MIDLHDIRKRLKPDSLLNALTDEQAEALLSNSRRTSFRRGEVIFNQGDRGDSAALILSGAVKISAFSSTGREIVFAYLSAGEMVGDLAVLDGSPRTASATSAEKVDCLIIQRSEIRRLIDKDPNFAQAVIVFLCARLRSTNLLLESDRSYENAARLARGILRLAREHGHRDGNSAGIGLAISQSDLGAFVSIARENVSRQISDWSRAGIVATEKGKLLVLDWEALEDIGDVWDDVQEV